MTASSGPSPAPMAPGVAGSAVRRQQLAGSAFAALGAGSYGVTIAIGRSLARAGMDSSTVLGTRFGIAGLTLVAVLLAARRPLLPAPGERLAAVALGAVGYATESTFFYLGLSHGTAAAVALLFYSYPAMVTVTEAVLGRSRPRPVVIAALALSVTGAALLAASGARIAISAAGAAFALASAAAFGVYLMTSERLMRATDSLTTAAWVALGASAALLTRAELGRGYHLRSGHAAQLVVYGMATGAAFTFMFAALRRLGSSQTAVVMTLEAVFAIALAAIFLHEGIGPVQVVGGSAILAAAVLISLQSPSSGHSGGRLG